MAKPPIQFTGASAALITKDELDALIVKGKADPTALRTLRCRTLIRHATLWSGCQHAA